MDSRFLMVIVALMMFLEFTLLTACSPIARPLSTYERANSADGVEKAAEAKGAADAAEIYVDLQRISEAVASYRARHNEMPTLDVLVKDGFLKRTPTIGKELGGGGYDVSAAFDDMDGQGEMDHAIYTTGPFLPEALCSEFNKRYAGAPLDDGTIFDYQAAGNKYPGEVYGREMKVFSIKWKTEEQGCEINWVLEYR